MTEQVERDLLIDAVDVLGVERQRLEILRLHQVGRHVDAGRRVLADIGDQRAFDAGKQDEIGKVGANRRIVGQLGHHIEGEEADGQAVGRGVAELVAAEQPRAAADILDHDGRMARNVVGQMLRDDAALDVGRAAGRIVDDHRDRLALVVLGLRACRNERGKRDQRCQHCSCHEWSSLDRTSIWNILPRRDPKRRSAGMRRGHV